MSKIRMSLDKDGIRCGWMESDQDTELDVNGPELARRYSHVELAAR